MGVPVGDSVSVTEDAEAKALQRQWKEYAEIYIKNINNIAESSTVLKELNGWLANNPFLAGTSLTQIDRTVFGLLFDQIASLSYSDKENFIHLSRWYNTLQKMTKATKGHVHFSRSLLY